MSLIRHYFTYIPNIVVDANFPSGRYDYPDFFFQIHFGPTEVLKYPSIKEHYQGADSRILAYVEGDSSHVCNGSAMSVAEFAITEGLRHFNSKLLSNNEALQLARIFSPKRSFKQIMTNAGQTTEVLMQYEDVIFSSEGELIQNIVRI
jgi:hypothetical protein